MKRILFLVLSFMCILSSYSSASEYYVEWFDYDDVIDVYCLGYDDYLEIERSNGSALCDFNGNAITPFDYDDIYMITDNLYNGCVVFGEDAGVYAFDKNGNMLQIYNSKDESLYYKMYELPGFQKEITFDFNEDEGYLNFILGNFILSETTDGQTTIFDASGNVIFDTEARRYGVFQNKSFPGKLVLYFESEPGFIGDVASGKYYSEANRIFSNNDLSTSFAAKVNGKYTVVDLKSMESKNYEFDEYVSSKHGSHLFMKNGKRYVVDAYGDIKYEGDKPVLYAAYDKYIIEENGKNGVCDNEFNMILPCEYDSIAIVADNVYMTSIDGVCSLFNQTKEVISGYDNFYCYRNYLIAVGFDSKKYLYDFEGNLLYDEDYEYIAGRYGIVVFDKENQRAGKLLSDSSNPLIEIDGKRLYTDTLSRIKNDYTLIPVRALAETTGFEVSYDDIAKDIKITKEDKEIIFTLGEKTAVSNGKEIQLEAAPEIINNRTLIPARAVTDAFGYDISWDEERRLVEITTE